MLTTPTIYLPGHDQGEPVNATPGSAGYDLPAILTRASLTNDDKRWFTWKQSRKSGFRMTAPDKREEFGNVVEYLRAVEPAEILKIKASTAFPIRHLALRIMPNETVRVPLGIKTAIDEDHVCLLFARASSVKKQFRLGNCVGVIDSDYRLEWFAAIRNCGTVPLVIEHGQPIVQAVFARRIQSTWPKSDTLPETNRVGGFGSTDELAEEVNAAPRTSSPVADSSATLSSDDLLTVASLSAEPPATDAGLVQSGSGGDGSDSAAEFIPVSLSCMGVNIGPVAKFRLGVHGVIYAEQGAAGVASILLREIATLAPQCLPQFVDALFAKVSEDAPVIAVPGTKE